MDRPMRSNPPLTQLLARALQGDAAAENEVLPLVHGQLCQIAYRQMRSRGTRVMEPAELVSDAFEKLFRRPRPPFKNRRHFFAVASRTMQNLWRDHLRRESRMKRRTSGERQPLEQIANPPRTDGLAAVDARDALCFIAGVDGRTRTILGAILDGGTRRDLAATLGTPMRTWEREWSRFKSRLRDFV